MKTEIAIPALCTSQQITSREHFHAALANVNALVKREDVSVAEAKETLTKAEALRAWAAYDSRLSGEEKKEANRTMTRTMRMLSLVAEREQPPKHREKGEGKGWHPGPPAWLMRELGVSRIGAYKMRKLSADDKLFNDVLESGKHWNSALSAIARIVSSKVFNHFARYTDVNGPLRLALDIHPKNIPATLRMVRKVKAWIANYEAALIKRQATEISAKEKTELALRSDNRRKKMRAENRA